MQHTVVLIDDEPEILDMQQTMLAQCKLQSEAFSDPIKGWDRIQRGGVALVITDWMMPGMSGLDLLFKTRAMTHPPYVIIVTAYGTVERAVQAMNEGAFNFLEKPFRLERYRAIVEDALMRFNELGTHTIVHRPEPASMKSGLRPGGTVIYSEKLKKVFELADAAAVSDSTVLLLGESGTGKEVVTDYIHQHSARRDKPLIKVNCGALPDTLVDSILFGHEKGAFTGADKRVKGRFEEANGGTLFLDEIGELPAALQVKLLRAIQQRTIDRLGASSSTPVDFRLICATNRDLPSAVAAKEFREDLYYRISVLPLVIPPLRERPSDIIPLANHFFWKIRNTLVTGPRDFSPSALNVLETYHWPGNARQLQNAVEYALVVCKGPLIEPADLPPDVHTTEAILRSPMPKISAHGRPSERGLRASIDEAQAAAIRESLERNRWNVRAVARELQISRSSLYERMDLFGIKRPDA